MNQTHNDRMLEDLMTPYHLILEKTYSEGAIYLGNQQSVGGFPDKWNITKIDYDYALAELKTNGIVAIVCCADETEVFPEEFTYLQLPLRDSPNCEISEYFDTNYNFIEEHRKKGNIIIHCNAGCSRSASMLISYLMKKYQMKYDNALYKVACIRSCVNVINFETYLKNYEIKLNIN